MSSSSGLRRALAQCVRGCFNQGAGSKGLGLGATAVGHQHQWAHISTHDDEQQQRNQQHRSVGSQRLWPIPGAGLLGARPLLSSPGLTLPSSLHTASLPSVGAQPLRSISTVSALTPARKSRTALGREGVLGLLASKALIPASNSRGYISEGQVLGAAFLSATDIMFWSGLVGAVVFRRNLIVMLLATEIVMLACNLNFLFAAAYLNDMTGVIMSITITTVAACETAIGLALCVTYFHLRSATDVEALNFLK